MNRRGFILSSAGGLVLPVSGIVAEEAPVPGLAAEWNAALLSAVRKETTPPCLVALKLAMLHKAIYLGQAHVVESQQRSASMQAALTMANSLYPSAEADFRELASRHSGLMKSNFPQADALAAGAKIAEAVLEERKGDGASTSQPYIPSEAPGQWRRTPPAMRPPELPHWDRMTKPFLLSSGEAFRPPGPPELTSAEYARAWDEVRRLGSAASTERTQDQTMAAHFWADFSYTETPPGHWNSIARNLAWQRRMSLKAEARLFFLLNASLADAAISCWEAKYHYNTWRPLTAIVRADEDGNGATAASKDWLPLLGNPPHPEYVSGHSTFSGAAEEVLGSHFGTGVLPFEVSSDTLKSVRRKFGSLNACVQEVSTSRVCGGIHFRFSCDAGVRLGRAVAKACARTFEA